MSEVKLILVQHKKHRLGPEDLATPEVTFQVKNTWRESSSKS